MERGPRRQKAGGVLLAVALGAMLLAAPAPAARRAPGLPPLRARVLADSLRLSRGVDRKGFDSLAVVLRRDIDDARRAGDRLALQRLLGLYGIAASMTGDGALAAPALDEALRLAEADRDTSWILPVLRYRAYTSGMRSRFDEQREFAERLIAIAEARGDERYLAVGHNFLGWIDRQRGNLREAQRHLERAIEAHRRLGNEQEEAIARTAYGATLMDLGAYAAARRSYERQLDIAKRLHLGWTEAQADNDLAHLETEVGDPSLALDYLRRAYELHLRRGETPDACDALLNLAVSERQIGRAKNAEDLAREGLAMSERRGFGSQRASFLLLLAGCAETEHQDEAAARGYQRVLALGDSASPQTRAVALLGLSRRLRDSGDKAAALALLENEVGELLPRLGRDDGNQLRLGWAARRIDAGRFAESIQILEPLLASGTLRGTILEESAWEDLAIARDRQGRPLEARAAFDSAYAHWEQRRQRTRSEEWRASPWGSSWNLALSSTEFLLHWPEAAPESTRVAAAWERAQRFRARTLEERVSGRAGSGRAGVALTAREVQSRILGPDELLLEWVARDEDAVLFAITRRGRRAFPIHYPHDIRARIAGAREFLATPPRGAADLAAQEQVARDLAATIFGPALPLVERAAALVLVPDGPIQLAPFHALILRSTPLAVSHTITLAPSAGLLAESRGRAGAEGTRGLLALATGSAPTRLAGARSEVAWLATAFEGVDSRPADAPVESPALADYRALHFAGHTTFDDRYPWRSGIDLGEGGSQSLLRAEAIAAMRLKARLVVLSSCETAAGTVANGEGVSGLSTAFLAAGVRTVVASLWPVDDRATETLMREFYRRLAMGLTASASLREAQAHVRRSPTTRAPHYWAGFEVLGDGRTRLELRPSAPWRRWIRG